jgi:hypothetical protein
MAAPPAAPVPGLNALLNNIQLGLNAYNNNRVYDITRKDVKEQISRTRACDGSIAADVREWIAEVELSIPILGATPGAVLEIAAGSARGPLRKELERFIAAQIAAQPPPAAGRVAVQWQAVRDHTRTVFLSQNEAERLRTELESMVMASYDTVAAYNLKFREAASAAYPLPRSADADRTLVHAYVRSLYDYMIKKKTLEGHPGNLDAAMHRAEELDANRDQVKRIIGDRKEEPMEVAAVGPHKAAMPDAAAMLVGMCDDLRRLTKEVAQLKVAGSPTRSANYQNPRPLKWTSDGSPICVRCGIVGHKGFQCRKNPTRQNMSTVPNTRYTKN